MAADSSVVPAPIAASSSVVDLCTLADAKLDAATSAKFFHDDDGAGGVISSCSWPEAERTTSKLISQSALQAICEEYKVPADYTPTILDGGRWVACRPPPEGSNIICVYADALEAGMRIPLHKFYVAVLRHYGLAPSQLAPDAWRYMAAFVLLSKDAGVAPSLPAFLSFFSICTHGGDSVGWHHFRCTPYFWSLAGDDKTGDTTGLFTGNLPRSPDEWKSRFFLLRSPSTTPWPCAVKWGKPSRAAVRRPVKTGETNMVMKKLLDRARNSGIDLMSFLSGRSPPVGPQAARTPPQRAVQVEAAAAAAGPWSEPTPTRKRSKSHEITTRRPDIPTVCGSQAQAAQQRNADMSTPPGFSPVGQRQRQSCFSAVGNDGSAMEGFVHSMRGTFQLAEKAMAELEEKEKELQASRAEVTQLRRTLAAANKEHAAEVARLNQEHAARVARLRHTLTVASEVHATEVAKLNQEVARLKQVTEKEVQDARKDMVLALLPKLDNSLLCSLQQEIVRRLQTDQS